ncbi:MAG: TetR family transcriptional regulator [Candidatus Dormibacteraeota bacterium]|nr:TetR family transcriptional regulator [Candidatus Dormibacteraeota bacterium]
MRSANRPSGQSFLEAARRAQIVGCAIETLAVEGYANASLARIAERAGVSKSVIVYHFGGKDQVLEAVVQEVFAAATAAVRPRVEAEPSAAGKLRAYLEARVGFLATHRHHMLALFEIWMNFRGPTGELRLGEGNARSTVEAIEGILREGQRSGEFATFSTAVMAMAVRQAVDGVLLQLRAEPDLDLDAYAKELVGLFDRATTRQT